MPTILVNLANLDPPRNGGVSRIAHEVAQLLCDMHGIQVVFAVGLGFIEHVPEWLGREASLIPYRQSTEPGPIFTALKPDFIVSPLFGIEPFEGEAFSRAVHITGIPDALSYDLPQLFLQRELESRNRWYQNARNARFIVTLSEYSRRQLITHLEMPEDYIRVVPLGADALETISLATATCAPLPYPYVFYPANNWAHKRHVLLFEVLAEIWKTRPELHLVLTGGRNLGVDIETLIAQAPTERVHDLGFVDEEHLKSLYENAEALLFTSEHEGFGMPIIEAMRCGCPVICAPVTAMPEVAGEAALFVNSNAPQDWAHVFLDRLPQQRATLIDAGFKQAAKFTWKHTQEGWAAVLAEAGLSAKPQSDAPLAIPVNIVAEELEMWRKHIVNAESSKSQKLEELEEAIHIVDAIRLSENQNRFGKLPIIGFFIRTLLRIRNLGRIWEATARMNWILLNQLTIIESQLKSKHQNEKME